MKVLLNINQVITLGLLLLLGSRNSWAQLPLQNLSCTGCSPTVATGYADGATASPATAPNTTYNLVSPYSTFTQCATVRTDANGTLGIINSVGTTFPQGNTTCSANTLASRKGSLYLSNGSGGCTGSEIQAVRKGSYSGTFNPEYVGLQPNTDYTIVIQTTTDATCSSYATSAVKYYGNVAPIFYFNCGTPTVTGTFLVGTPSAGTISVPITGATAATISLSVTGTGFTGSTTTTLTSGQTSVTIPITYDGTGSSGARTLTITSNSANGACSGTVNVIASPGCVIRGACNIVSNGTFDADLSSWTNSGGWAWSGGAAYNFTENVSNQSLSQSVTGLNSGPVANQVTLTFTVIPNNVNGSTTPTATTAQLVVQLGGTTFATLSNNSTNTLAITASNGATVTPATFAFNGAVSASSTTITVTIPWVSQPNTANLAFLFTATSDDFGVDDVTISETCTSGPTLWLKADVGTSTTTEGGNITAWNDQSGNGRNATTTTNTGYTTPTSAGATYRSGASTSALNFNPTVDFTTNRTLDGINGLSTRQVFSVYVPIATGKFVIGYDDVTAGGAGGGAQAGQFFTATDVQHTARNTTGNNLIYSSIAHNGVNIPQIFDGQHVSASAANALVNGAGISTPSVIGTAPNPYRGSYRLGGTSDNQYQFGGRIAEVVSYDLTLSAADRQKVTSYLGLKYGITILHNYVNPRGTTIYNIATHSNNITGIGRDNCADLNQKQSKSTNTTALVTVGLTSIAASNAANTATLADSTYAIFGDDNGALAWQTTESQAGKQRLTREWKITETGTVSALKVQIPDDSSPLSTKMPAEQSGAAMYLMVDADGDFSSGATLLPLTLNGTNWELSYDFPVGTSYFTVAFQASENCTNNIDDDGDGLIDCNDPDCKPIVPRLVGRN